MTADELIAYYDKLREELNPSIFVSERVSHWLMNVEWSISEKFAETVDTCVSQIREIIVAWGLSENLLFEVLSTSPANSTARTDFLRIWNAQILSNEAHEIEAVAELAIYCFTHIVFLTAKSRSH